MLEFPKIEKGEEIYLSKETEAILRNQVDKCFLCRFVLEDQAKHGKLTGYPFDYNGNGIFPIEGKVAHIQLERLSWENSSPRAEPGATRTT